MYKNYDELPLMLSVGSRYLKIERVCVGEGKRFPDTENRRASRDSERQIYRMDQQKRFKVKRE